MCEDNKWDEQKKNKKSSYVYALDVRIWCMHTYAAFTFCYLGCTMYFIFNPFRTPVPFWAHIWECGAKGVDIGMCFSFYDVYWCCFVWLQSYYRLLWMSTGRKNGLM